MQIVIYYNKFRNIKEREKMLFSEEAIGFLFENHTRDSKEWFKELGIALDENTVKIADIR